MQCVTLYQLCKDVKIEVNLTYVTLSDNGRPHVVAILQQAVADTLIWSYAVVDAVGWHVAMVTIAGKTTTSL